MPGDKATGGHRARDAYGSRDCARGFDRRVMVARARGPTALRAASARTFNTGFICPPRQIPPIDGAREDTDRKASSRPPPLGDVTELVLARAGRAPWLYLIETDQNASARVSLLARLSPRANFRAPGWERVARLVTASGYFFRPRSPSIRTPASGGCSPSRILAQARRQGGFRRNYRPPAEERRGASALPFRRGAHARRFALPTFEDESGCGATPCGRSLEGCASSASGEIAVKTGPKPPW